MAVEAEATAERSELFQIVALDRQRVQHLPGLRDRDVRRLRPEVTDPKAAPAFQTGDVLKLDKTRAVRIG